MDAILCESSSRASLPMRGQVIPDFKEKVMRYHVRINLEGRFFLERSIDGGQPHVLLPNTFPTAESAIVSLNNFIRKG